MKKNKGRSASERLRVLKASIAVMLMLIMVFSGLAPSLYSYAEEGAEAAAEQVQTENEAPAEETVTPSVNEEPAIEDTAETPALSDAVSSEDTDTESSEAADSGSDETSGADKTAPASNEKQDEKAADSVKDDEKYPAQSFSGSTSELDIKVAAQEGVFPEGTEMKAVSVSASSVIDAAQSVSGDDCEVVDAAAADITFWHEGSEIQPEKSVRVKLRAKRAIDGESHDAVTVDDSGNASVVADATSNSGKFSTDHFTIYGIIGTDEAGEDAEKYDDDDVKQYVRCRYVFYAGDPETDRSGWKAVSTQILRDGEKIKLPDPPAHGSAYSFDGWFRENESEKMEDGGTVTLDPSVLSSKEEGGGQERDITVKVYASFSRKYKVTLYTDHTKQTVYETHLLSRGETLDTLPAGEDADFALDIEDGCDFSGWKIADTEDKDIVTSVAIDKEKPADIELVPVFTSIRIVRFVVNPENIKGLNAAEVLEQHVHTGGMAHAPAWPVKGAQHNGYVFEGWFEKCELNENTNEYEFTGAYNFDKKVEDDMVLYAEWDPQVVTFTVEVYQEKQNAVGEYSLKSRSTAADAESYNFKGKPLTPINADMISGARTYAEGLLGSTEKFHLSRTGATDTSSDPYAIEVWEGGKKAAEYDVKTNSWISGEADALIHGHGETVVRVYQNRDTYNIHFLFKDGTNQETYNTTGYTTVREDHQQHLPEGLATEDTLAGQSYTVRYKDNMYRTVYLNEVNPLNAGNNNSVIAALMDKGWYFDGTYYRAENGQTVFNKTNSGYNLNPRSDMTDGMDVVCLISYNDTMIPHHFITRYYRPDGELKDEHDTVIMYANTPHSHGFNLLGENEGYKLVSISTGDKVYTEKNYNSSGMESYTFEYDSDKKAKPMVLRREPVAHSVSFDPQDGSGIIKAVNDGTWKNYADDDAFFVDDKYDYTASDKSGAGRYEAGKTTRVADGIMLRFDGWYDNAKCEGKAHDFDGGTMPGRDLVFYGKWTPMDCTVVFHPNNGDKDSSQKVVIGGKVHRIANPEKDGSVFGGWYLDNDTFGKAYDFATVLSEEKIRELEPENEVEVIHLYAKWNSRHPYTVVYHANGGSFKASPVKGTNGESAADPVRYRGGSEASVKFTAEKVGSVFTGWAVGTAAGKTLITGGQTFAADSANDKKDGTEDQVIHLYALFADPTQKVTVTYHSNYPQGPDLKAGFTEAMLNGAFIIKAPDDSSVGFGNNYRAADGSFYEFVCWTNSKGEKIFTDSNVHEYFSPGEKAAAGAEDAVDEAGGNDLYAVWKPSDEVIVSSLTEKAAGIPGSKDGTPTKETVKTPVSSKGVRTGDSSYMALYAGMMALAAATLVLLLIRRKRRREDSE